ncbi:MAG: hypothetical protein OEV76_01745 [Anaerolineae bacterium]|nr:hypothetical protein [Anaerolineae bacterium]
MEATRSAQRVIPLKGWLDEVLVILLVIVALLLGWLVRSWVQGQTATFTSDDGAVSLRYPAGWLQQTDKDTLLTVSDVRANGSFKPSFSLTTREMNPDYPLTASDVLVSLSVQRAEQLTAYRVLNVDEGTVDGLDASSLTYAYVSEPEGGLQASLPVVVEAVDWVVLRGGKAYVFSFAAPAEEFSSRAGAFSSIMSSVDFR